MQLITDVPARLFGLTNRGQIAVGNHADIVVMDPSRVGAAPARLWFDLPGESKRLLADPVGVEHVLVNGRETIVSGEPTGDLPGQILRAGRNTGGTDTAGL